MKLAEKKSEEIIKFASISEENQNWLNIYQNLVFHFLRHRMNLHILSLLQASQNVCLCQNILTGSKIATSYMRMHQT